MSPRTGRPTDSPKNTMLRVRVDEGVLQMLDECAEKLNLTRSEVIRKGIKTVYLGIKK